MRALVFGAAGQDGVILTNHLLKLGYEVIGSASSETGLSTIRCFSPGIESTVLDVSKPSMVSSAIKKYRPTHIFNLAAASSVANSWIQPASTMEVNTIGLINILTALQELQLIDTRVFQASSSEMFGGHLGPLDEHSTPTPMSPYALSKLAAHQVARIFREVSGLRVSCGILFNHESPLRPDTFVSRRVSKQVAEIKVGKRDHLLIGDLKSFRDWGWAPDYVDAMELVINAERPDDFIIATGFGHSVAEMIQFAFESIGVKDWENYTQIDPDYFRPNDVNQSTGNPQKTRMELGWKHSRSLPEIMSALVAFDSALLDGEERHIAAQRAWKDSNPPTV